MIKDEVGVGIYLELWAGYNQLWGRSTTISWTIGVGVGLYLEQLSKIKSRMR